MLVLSRQIDDEIVFVLEDGRTIQLRPLALHGGRVRIGIEAPKSIKVHRREVLDRITEERTHHCKSA